jgi:uncharacterized repeat protein (TIGR02543 family)
MINVQYNDSFFIQTVTWLLWKEAFANSVTTELSLPLGRDIAPFNALYVEKLTDKLGLNYPGIEQAVVGVSEKIISLNVSFSTSALGEEIQGKTNLRRQIGISKTVSYPPDSNGGSITLGIDSSAIGGKIPVGWIMLSGTSSTSGLSASFSGGSLISGDTIVIKGANLSRADSAVGNRYLIIPIISSPKITFDPNGGYLPPAERIKYVDAGEKLGTLPIPGKDKSELIGWFTSRDGGEEVTEETIIPRNNVTYYAHWRKTTVLVSLDARGGSVNPSVIEAIIGAAYGALPTPSRFLSQFDGWFTEPDGGGSKVTSESIVSIEEDHSLYAKWIIEEGRLIYSASGNLILDDTSR